MTQPFQVFHSSGDNFRNRVHVVLVRPEVPGNVGAAARSLENMGACGDLAIIGSPDITQTLEAQRRARHASHRLDNARHFESLPESLRALSQGERPLSVAATARSGSPSRPHPVEARQALVEATEALKNGEITDLILVFGPESDGLSNEDIAACQWLATVPTAPGYRSLNLAQSVLLFTYEVHRALLEFEPKPLTPAEAEHRSLTQRFVEMADRVGFILPGDPHKMGRRLRKIFETLPRDREQVRTLHGLLEQLERTLDSGRVEFKGRYKHKVEQEAPNGILE